VIHLEENLAAAKVQLTDEQFEELSRLGQRHAREPATSS
jgi:diketogulonate reductase-like aldo/keto reductase